MKNLLCNNIHMHEACTTHAFHTPNTCRLCTTHARHMHNTCKTHAQHMHNTWKIHAQHMQDTCTTHARYVHNTCKIHAQNMQDTCTTHARPKLYLHQAGRHKPNQPTLPYMASLAGPLEVSHQSQRSGLSLDNRWPSTSLLAGTHQNISR